MSSSHVCRPDRREADERVAASDMAVVTEACCSGPPVNPEEARRGLIRLRSATAAPLPAGRAL
ncbi:hypothetical protein EYF80_049005 [Liparis tanakae]|uniref:Uncharacterized protein n=1 Tax=Liparis tanakae TaxID=230148 RepID=A0A4Z2FKM2_9TELE|nr:hypothetical protein EYF80_049005 [Liparis tanakae]